MAARPGTPASPKNFKIQPPQPGQPLYGCEHVQRLFNQDQATTNTSIQHYKAILRNILDYSPINAQTAKAAEGPTITTSLTSTYLCLQCPSTLTEDDCVKHGNKKSHRFYVDSRSGALYCQMCDDIVWDPTFEDLRLTKIGTGSFTASRKRKQDDLLAVDPVKDNPQYISTNTTVASCKASGLRGIYNAGATCYQNVVLQSFLHNPVLRNFYLSDGHQSSNCEVPYCLSCAMDDMFQDFYAVENTNGYTAANILSGFWISEKKAFENLVTTKEQDAHEFFQFLAEELHERNGDGKKPETGSEHSCNCIIHQTFYGKLQSTTTCQHCAGVTNQVQSFLDLSLPLENLTQKKGKKSGNAKAPAMTLQECLDEEYIKSDKCEYRCHSCNSMQQARRQTAIKCLPNVLSIQLKRFEFKQGRNERAAKIETPVHFPLQLNMLPYTERARTGDTKENFELARSCTYDLLSVVVHVGEIDTGHYVSYCRVGDQWFAFNDHKVELASKSDVLGAKAYLLFYIVRSLA
ncbi:ubiquitin carboxyl-terminal hydrolase-like protein [Lasiosphaeris hirsuta]|uniref:Ubiquitin carboxyl-terminal hydrolase-like protein n=1 Tax=Lasiosphaeris hirsuta TaxID=260670 RepID=A0AA40E4J8_9PEZI|nr:ubiquitin carboxyl-terminal hydrolase-like protein [Lasiosphaeris hirsuta]